MFDFLKRKNNIELYAPVSGKVINLEKVPDPMFSSKCMGEGIAFELCDNLIVSPCNGKVIMIANTLHAIGIQINDIQILIHVGLDTVNLEGKGFKQLVSLNEKVKIGTPLLEVDLDYMKENNINTITPMIMTAIEKYKMTNLISEEELVNKGETKVIELNI